MNDKERLLVDHAIYELQRELDIDLNIHERIAVERVLEQLVDDVPRKGLWQ